MTRRRVWRANECLRHARGYPPLALSDQGPGPWTRPPDVAGPGSGPENGAVPNQPHGQRGGRDGKGAAIDPCSLVGQAAARSYGNATPETNRQVDFGLGPISTLQSRTRGPPRGTRNVATGKRSAARGEDRLLSPAAPEGRRNSQSFAPPGREGSVEKATTGSAPAGCAAPPLHRWLQSLAPAGPKWTATSPWGHPRRMRVDRGRLGSGSGRVKLCEVRHDHDLRGVRRNEAVRYALLLHPASLTSPRASSSAARAGSSSRRGTA
jgi:hypothetical protein